MVASRGRRHLRRIGYGVVLGAGIAVAPFALAAATADPGTVLELPGAAQSAVVHAKPMTVTRPVAPRVKAVQPQTGSTTGSGSVVVIGASVSAGHAVSGAAAFPRQVSAISGRPVYVSARNGAAYHDGSIGALTQAANLSGRHPSLVVLQAGSNDVGASPAAVSANVRQVVQTVRSEAPNAKIAVLTVFPSLHSGSAAAATDAAIIGAARSVDPTVSVISPLGEGWRYRPTHDGHPGAGTHTQIAERVAALA